MSDKELYIKVVNDPVYAENGMIVSLGEGRPCWIIDPGLPPQAQNIVRHIADQRLQPEAIIITHAHGDHIAGIDELREAHPHLPVYLAEQEWAMLPDPMKNLSGLHGEGVSAKSDNLRDLAPGTPLHLDGTTWEVLDTSGHSPGGRSIYCPSLSVAFVGDAVFAGSIGRVDFPHSDGERLLKNIRDNLMTLPDETTLIPGHGPSTTVKAERETNPFLQGM